MATIFLTNFLANCTVGTPFTKSNQSKQLTLKDNQKIILSITEAHTSGSIFDRFTFWRRVSDVRNDLDNNQGYLGGAIRREIFGSKAWTMTAWVDEQSLEDFVLSREHDRAIKEGSKALAKANFYRKEMEWRQVPLSWEEAIQELECNPDYEK
jgi:heme-degrading monooxygenase HmoA